MTASETSLETIAAWAADVGAAWPDSCIGPAQHAIADTVGCMVSGAGDEAARRVLATLSGWSRAHAGATFVGGDGMRGPAPFAAYANGTAAHAQDFDDNFLAALTHASAVLVPALLAVAEETGATGAQVVDAYLVGLECHAALGRGVNRSHYLKGWHATATVGCIGTAAACARLMGLKGEAMLNAMSLGVSMAAGLKGQFGSQAKPMQAGMAAQNAVIAAAYARDGLTGRAEVLDNAYGFLNLFGGDAPPGWDFEKFPLGSSQGGGPRHVIEAVGLAPKCHPCCGSAHKSIDNLLDLKKRHGFGADDVEAIHARVNTTNLRNLCFPDPVNEMEARFSMHYCLAVALKNDFLSLKDFTPEAVMDPEIRALLTRTEMTATPPESELDPSGEFPHELTVRLKSGDELRITRTHPRGTLADPFTDEDRWRKFEDCCQPTLGAEATRRLYGGFSALSETRDLSELMGLLATPPAHLAA